MNRQKRSLLNQTYHHFLRAGFGLEDAKSLKGIVDEKLMGFGTTIDEKIMSVAELKELIRQQKVQTKGMDLQWKIKPLSHYTSSDENTAVFADELFLKIIAGAEPVIMYMRFSIVLSYFNDKWKVIHWHGSKPEHVQSDEDTFGLETWKRKAEALEKVVQERTEELVEKNKELEIETSLERVRSRTMAMRQTSELKEVIQAVHKELLHLKLTIDGGSFIVINDDVKTELRCWGAGGTADTSEEVVIPDFNLPFIRNLVNGIKKRKRFFTEEFSQKEKKEFFSKLFKYKPWSELSNTRKEETLASPGGYTRSVVVSKHSSILIINHQGKKFTNDQNEILKRFGKVFEQTYIRFLDLQNAEAQAREAQVEAALERVRSRSMAMHKSDELKEVIRLVLDQFIHLNIKAEHAGFYIDYKAQDDMHIWLADPNIEPFFAIIPYFDTPTWKSFLDAKAKGTPLHTDLLDFEEKNKFYQSLFKLFTVPEEAKEFYMQCKGLAVSTVLLDNVGLYIENFSAIPYTGEENKILMRFGKVFQQTYTRFLDLQKAETQAREAQIEAALERVRSRSLAMHNSDELKEVIDVVFSNLNDLNISRGSVAIWLFDKQTMNGDFWVATPLHKPEKIELPYDKELMKENTTYKDSWEAFREGKSYFNKGYSKQQKDRYFNYVFSNNDLSIIPLATRDLILKSDMQSANLVVEKHSTLFFDSWNGVIYDADSIAIFKRISRVFEQAYVRFLDLQKAEAQAREAQIETALERVRSRTMSMQKSSELLPTAEIMFDQLKQLGAELQGVAFAICDENSTKVQKWTSIGNFSHPYDIEPGEQRMYEAWKNQSGMYEEVYEGEKQKKYYELFMEIPEFRNGLQKVIDLGIPIPAWQKNYAVPFKNGYVLFIVTKPFNETQIFIRFGKVFEQTYTRFLDLQTAETAAKEAVKQAALDRIRADIAAMRTTKDLDRISPLIWNELTILGIPFIRCGVFIMDDEKEHIHTFLSTPDGQAITAFHLPYSTHGNISLVLKNWRDNKSYVDHWDEQMFMEFTHTLVTQGALSSVDDYMKTFPAGGFYLHFLPFLQGMLYVGNSNQLSEDEINLVQSLADAFSSAYARYEDFNKLEAAKKQVDVTLTELKATQKQLIQSEKMASLGELTAGIAHEIQNPLNFVNNFSQLNSEMIEELNIERAKPITERDEQLEDELLADIKSNSEKINLHGKRADAIVKGMLQHSRKSTGQKEPTDITALCDEYLRLSYHGMRAKDKSFNAEMKTDYDSSIGKINIIPQDIGRVLLNIINNAFYAVNEKKILRQAQGDDYQPTVSITTKKLDKGIEIKVADNGNGISDKIKDKIFQPFFTTKPTGSGTGLGLSLSYDIVKAHGGEIKLETQENKGSEFAIELPLG